jgi:hypothetical protein
MAKATGGSMRSLVVLILLSTAAASAQDHRPTLKETLEWMHDAFPESQTMSSSFRFGQTRELSYVDGKDGAPPSCTITIVDRWTTEGKPVTRSTAVDLSLIDPDSIQSYKDDTVEKDTGVLTLVATNDKKVIIEKTETGKKGDKPPYMTEREFISFVTPDYAGRFAKAFRNAVTLCGGKKSAF